MSEAILTQVITAITAIVSVLVGGFATYMGTKHIESIKIENEKRSLRAGFLSEIKSLLTIITERGYLESINEMLENEEIQKGEKVAMISIRIPEDYAIFYKANVAKVGTLDSASVEQIILFHQLLQAVVQDFHPESQISQHGFDHHMLTELSKILSKVIETGKNII